MTGVCEACGGRTWTLIDREWRCVACVTMLPFRRARRLQAEVERLRAWLAAVAVCGPDGDPVGLACRALTGAAPPEDWEAA